MSKRTVCLTALIMSLLLGTVVIARPAGAAIVRDVDPTTIDPTQLALPPSALPAGAVVDHSAVSDNTDADTSKTHILHNQLYETWHRLTGYRMDFHYTVSGISVEAGFLTSIFPTPAEAAAALDNATNAQSIIAFIGQPLPDPCTSGDVCKGYSGPNPDDGTKTALTALFTRGPILVEASAQVPNTAFSQVGKQMEAQDYLVAAAEDAQVKQVLHLSAEESTATPTATPTVTPTVTPTPTPRPHKKHKACKKGYSFKHGKCRKVKKRSKHHL